MPDLITTDRLTLRAPRADDAVLVVPLIGDLEVARWLTTVPHPYGLDDARDFIASQTPGTVWFLWHAATLVGCVSIRSELGYWIARSFWGRGLASEAARAVVGHHFASGSDDLESGHFVENRASRRVLTKLGFVETAQRKAKCRATGEDALIQRMVLTRSDWEARA